MTLAIVTFWLCGELGTFNPHTNVSVIFGPYIFAALIIRCRKYFKFLIFGYYYAIRNIFNTEISQTMVIEICAFQWEAYTED